MNTFQITSRIDHIYPDIEDQLCSKHTITLNQIHKNFLKTIPNLNPSHYIIANKAVTLVQSQNYSLNMALEHGVTLMVAKIKKQEKQIIFLSNKNQQIVLSPTGDIVNSETQPQLSLILSRAVELATEDLSLNKVQSGFITINYPDGESFSSCSRETLIATFTAILLLNNLISEYTMEDLIHKLKTLTEFRNNNFVENYFFHSNRQFLVCASLQTTSVPMDSKYKLLFLNLSSLQLPSPILTTIEADASLQMFIQGKSSLEQLMSDISTMQMKCQQQNFISGVKEVLNSFKFRSFILYKQYLVVLVEGYRYAEVLGKMSRVINQKNKIEKDSSMMLQTKIKSGNKSNMFTSVPSSGVAILDPSTSLWF